MPELNWTVPTLVNVDPLATERLLELPLPVAVWSRIVPSLLAPPATVSVAVPYVLLPCTTTIPTGESLLIKVEAPMSVTIVAEVIEE